MHFVLAPAFFWLRKISSHLFPVTGNLILVAGNLFLQKEFYSVVTEVLFLWHALNKFQSCGIICIPVRGILFL